MKRIVLLSVFALALSHAAFAQDDMYFVPTKANVEKSARDYGMPRDTYYCGSHRSVDEYNRHGSYVQEIDSAGNDIIDFDYVAGIYPDTLSGGGDDTAVTGGGDYEYTRRMSRFDDYAWNNSYWAGYYDGRSASWYYPWYSSAWYYYDPWYCGWYDPWYYGHYGWYGYWGGWHGSWWGRPHYAVAWRGGHSGTANHMRGTGRRPLAGYGGGTASVTHGIAARSRGFSSGVRNRTFNASERFGTSRTGIVRSTTTTRHNATTISQGSFGGSRSGGGFGGSRSGGGSGGSRGGFGGRR